MNRIIALLLVASVLFFAGCQTFKGLGKDVQKAGEWVQEKAE